MDILHTDAAMMPLTQMVGDAGHVQVGTDATGTKRDCMSGWCEPMANPVTCTPHHLVVCDDETVLVTIAEALAAAGYQAVITDFSTWSENQRIFRYNDTHQH